MIRSLQNKLRPRSAYVLGLSSVVVLLCLDALVFAPNPQIRNELGKGIAIMAICLLVIGFFLIRLDRSYKVWWDVQSVHMTPPTLKSMLGLEAQISLRLSDVGSVRAYEPRE